jgi:DNA polymerase III delta subunit
MIFVYFGNNEFSINRSIEDIIDESNKEVLKISLEKIDLVEFQNIVFNVPLINDGRIIFAKNLIKKIFNTENYLDWINVISKSIEVPGNTKLLFSEHFEDIQEISKFKKSKFFHNLNDIAQLEEILLPKGKGSRAEMLKWINLRSQELGVQLNSKQSSQIENILERDFFSLDQELTKLALYTKGRKVNDQDIVNIVSGSKNEIIFNVLDLIIDGDYLKSIPIIRKLYDQGVNSGELIFLLISSIHRILHIRSLIDEGVKKADEISSSVGLTNNYYFKKLMGQASLKTVDNLFMLLEELLEIDKKIKTENIDEKQEIELLLVKLSSISVKY